MTLAALLFCWQDAGRVFKGKKMPGRMGGKRITTQNVKVCAFKRSVCDFADFSIPSSIFPWQLYSIDVDRNLLFVVGPVPGPAGSFLRISDALKKDLPDVSRLTRKCACMLHVVHTNLFNAPTVPLSESKVFFINILEINFAYTHVINTFIFTEHTGTFLRPDGG